MRMSDRTLRRLAWLVAAPSMAMAGAAIAIGYPAHSPVLSGYGLATALTGAVAPLCGALILTRRPRNVIGWLFCFIGFWQAVEPFSGVYAIQALTSGRGVLPLGSLMAWLSVWTWAPGLGVAFTFLFLLYPDGALPSPRWRPVGWLSAAAIFVVTVPLAAATWGLPDADLLNQTSPATGFRPVAYAISQVGTVAALPIVFACVTSLWLRLRHASGEARQQIKWFAYGAVIWVAGVVTDGFLTGGSWISVLVAPAVPIAAGVAILKYRLYDIDVVISRTLVYGTLAVFITAVYVGIAVGFGALVGGGGKPNLGLSILATAIVAIGFQPVRERLQRVANRLVYGKRATPYEVLSQFSERVAESYATDDVLPRMARVLAEGTGAQRADVWLRSGGTLRAAASWPAGVTSAQSIALSNGSISALPNGDRVVEVRQQNELLGALSVSKRSGEPLTPIEEKLLDDLAHQAGLVLKNVGLSADLAARLEELRASRQRLVAAQDDERRRLERNLHDGAQQHLVALKVKLGLVEMQALKDPDKARATLSGLKRDADEALETLRDLARGIYPPLLADRGLGVAIESQARRATVPVAVDAVGIARYPQEVEAAVYFCVLEALQNVMKYAHAAQVTIRLTNEDSRLCFAVEDDGRGFDVAAARRGAGLTNMQDRLDSLGGSLSISSIPGRGTLVSGVLVAEALATVGAVRGA